MRPVEFKLLPKEQERYERWLKRHRHKNYSAVSGLRCGGVEFHFTPTGIGDAVEVECKMCKEKKNLTDYESW